MSKNGKDTGTVEIHGKTYETVALRVRKFRATNPDYTLQTEIVSRDEDVVVMKASILDEKGRLIATGHAEEKRAASTINRTSALENAETSAIGRALAAFGLGGTEFATADEVANAISQQRPPNGSARAETVDTYEKLPKETQKRLMDVAVQIRDYLQEERVYDAYELASGIKDSDEKTGLWSLLDAKQRSALKKFASQAELATQG